MNIPDFKSAAMLFTKQATAVPFDVVIDAHARSQDRL